MIIMCSVDELTSYFYTFTGPLDFQEKNLKLLIACFLNLVAKVGSHTQIWHISAAS